MIAVLDCLLAACLLALAWVLLRSADLFRAIVFYVIFGLLMALLWARLAAVDVALVEAAVGAGITGALFLAALTRMRTGAGEERRLDGVEERSWRRPFFRPGPSGPGKWLIAALLLLLLGTGVRALWPEPGGFHPLPGEVREHLEASGVANPVTAVLLNFRGYDTLLEMSVLLLAAIGVLAMRSGPLRISRPLAIPIFQGFVRLITPLLVVFAGYLLRVGSQHPGGAFQAGALLAASGILLYLQARAPYFSLPAWGGRLAMGAGLAVFLACACQPLRQGKNFLEYPEDLAGACIFLIETAAVISIAACLFVLFVQALPAGREKGRD
ncbi:hydrogenase subunit MbhD domain-containing protein [Thiovibrio sp. JS02]